MNPDQHNFKAVYKHTAQSVSEQNSYLFNIKCVKSVWLKVFNLLLGGAKKKCKQYSVKSTSQRVLNDLQRTRLSRSRMVRLPPPVSKFSLFPSLPVCPRSSLPQEGGGEAVGRSQIIRQRVSLLLYKSFNTPWYVHSYLSLSKQWMQKTHYIELIMIIFQVFINSNDEQIMLKGFQNVFSEPLTKKYKTLTANR